MNDQRDDRPKAPLSEDRLEVWVCVLATVDSLETWVCATEALAYRELADACRDHWADALYCEGRIQKSEDQPAFPAVAPTEDRAAAEAYFALMSRALPPESFVIAPRRVIDAQTECVR